jgi:muramidase (phage lysozyme)
MPFELVAPSIRQVIRRQYLTDVTIHRYLYQHSWARLVIDWDEGWREGDKHRNGLRPTTQIGASLLNAEVAIRWRGKDLASQVDCFRGYVARVSARHTTTRSFLVLDCISHSKRTDLIPRYRVWQDCTLLDICQHIASREPLIQIAPEAQSVLGDITIQLSVQYGETDFAYLSRMMHAWGIPLAVDDRAGKVIIGSPQIASSGTFPELNWHWRTLALEGHLVPLDSKARSASAGTLGIAKLQVNQFNQSLSRIASDYFPKLDEEHQEELIEITDRMYDNIYASDTVFYRLEWEGYVYDYSPGNIVQWGGQPLLIRACFIHGDHRADSATQTFILQDHLAPVQPHKRRVKWPSRTLWARVVKNNDEDPTKSGRVQVEFDWEKLDPTSKGQNRCWLPTLTPYGGLKGKSGTSGFLSLPEVGEHVLVQFLDEWDSDAVVIGSVREYPREGFVYDPHETKRWQTPSGNQVTMTTTDGGKTDIVRLKCRDKMVFEARITADKEIVILDLCDSDNDRIHFQKGGGPTRLDIFCSEEIYIHAGQKLYIEGGQIQITSKSGGLNLKSAANIEIQGMTIDVDGSSGVNIDGAVVKLNCPPAVPHKHWSLQPLKKERDQKSEGGETKKKRAKRARWAAAAPSSAQSKPSQKQAWSEKLKELEEALQHPNVRAMLQVIRYGEGTTGDKGYQMLFGGEAFNDFTKHPNKKISKGGYTTTAAGAYQFLSTTWQGLVAQYGFQDFSPHNQDLGAVALIKQRGALEDVKSGRFRDAIYKISWEWASLPGPDGKSRYGQPAKSIEELEKIYKNNGGRVSG